MSIMRSFPAAAVVGMLDAADEAHIKRLNEENERGGEARQVVADVARTLGVVLADTGVGQLMWDPANMRRVVRAAQVLSDDRSHWEAEAGNLREEVEKLRDLLRIECERANAAIDREETAEKAIAELRDYVRQLGQERDNYKRAYESKPASMRLEGPEAERLIEAMQQPVHHTKVIFRDSPALDVDDLKATIISQAREIARLKGESA
ncbi:hypothetical protein [Streptomyces sp. IBSNAI001]|uniref:hypothetical protein n=1 Tax=Streptomyces sp. IBSNAI001 TaxID=3457499 RepID=UPI003FD60AE1